MTDPLQEQLLGHLLGALDDAEAKSVADRLESDPEFCKQLELVRPLVEPLTAALAASCGEEDPVSTSSTAVCRAGPTSSITSGEGAGKAASSMLRSVPRSTPDTSHIRNALRVLGR